MKAELAKHVADGTLKAAEATTEQSFIVFRDVAADGTILDPRNQLAIVNIKGDLKEKFLGKKVGDLVSVLPDRNIEILEVYDITPPAAPEAQTAAVSEVQETSNEGEANVGSEEPKA
jgi:hypothetical protein